MTTHSLPPTIAAAFDPQLFYAAGQQLVEQLTTHLARVQEGKVPVLPWSPPADKISQATQWMQEKESPGETADLDRQRLATRFSEIVHLALKHGNNLHHPHYVGHQVPAPVPLAGLFDAVGAVTNQVMAIYEMGPWATAAEHAVLEAIGTRIGWNPDEFGGVITSGASLANLTALLTARNVSLAGTWHQGIGRHKNPVLVAHAEAHYSTERAAGVLGIGTDHIVKAEIDARRAMDPQRLDDTLADLRRRGTPIVAVVAFACATPIGAFDPLTDIAAVCKKYDVWLHVDAAHGGAACMSHKHRHLLTGLELADSAVCDAHKMFFMPALCALLFYRDGAHCYGAFDQHAPYLFDPLAADMSEYDSGRSVFECTKRAAAYGIWGTWSMFGPSLFEEMVDTTFRIAQEFYELLATAEDFEVCYRPECNIVAFRHLPPRLRDSPRADINRFQAELRRRVIESGSYYLVSSVLDGQNVLRTTIINPVTEKHHLVGLLDALRIAGEKLLDHPQHGKE